MYEIPKNRLIADVDFEILPQCVDITNTSDKFCDGIVSMLVLCRFWIWKRVARVQLLRRFDGGSRQCSSSSSEISSEDQVCQNTGYDRIFAEILWLFSPALDAIKLTLKKGFICPFVVIDPTNLGTITELLFQALCLFIFAQSPTQNICLFTDGNKAN